MVPHTSRRARCITGSHPTNYVYSELLRGVQKTILTGNSASRVGTALGDWLADGPLGYLGAAAVFGASLALLALLY